MARKLRAKRTDQVPYKKVSELTDEEHQVRLEKRRAYTRRVNATPYGQQLKADQKAYNIRYRQNNRAALKLKAAVRCQRRKVACTAQRKQREAAASRK